MKKNINKEKGIQKEQKKQLKEAKSYKKEEKISEISLILNPLQSLRILILMTYELILSVLKSDRLKLLIVLISLGSVYGLFTVYEKNDNVIMAKSILKFIAYWIILGVASSIGLGTGLHTFVLYLGPHIAKVVLMANECNAVPLFIPNKFEVQSFNCPLQDSSQELTILQLVTAVQLESILWGFGTALGELPPYFIAKAAAIANEQLADELNEIDQIQKNNDTSLVSKIKLAIYSYLQKYAFLTVLLCASIPNPLFDLAGITCGHFQIPFSIFFTATSIGKAIIKTHIQMLFVIIIFSKNKIQFIINYLENKIPYFKGKLIQIFEKQKAALTNPNNNQESEKPIIAQLWDYIILAMIVYFLYSIFTSLVNQYHQKEQKNKKQKHKNK